MPLPMSRRAFAGTLGPAAKAAANRYPDALEKQAREAIAKHHGVAPDQVLLGCGSSEILQMADEAFSGPERASRIPTLSRDRKSS